MIYRETRAKLAELFKECSQVYRQQFDVQLSDEAWAAWYAQQVQGCLEEVLQARITLVDLTQLLLMADEMRQVQAPAVRCADFFTQFFIQYYLPGNDHEVHQRLADPKEAKHE